VQAGQKQTGQEEDGETGGRGDGWRRRNKTDWETVGLGDPVKKRRAGGGAARIVAGARGKKLSLTPLAAGISARFTHVLLSTSWLLRVFASSSPPVSQSPRPPVFFSRLDRPA
jgi:hypothetical protein